MNDSDAILFARLQETFRVEAREHLESISSSLMVMEGDPATESGREALEVMFRAVHSLKGGSRIVNLTLIEFLCQSVEECLAAIRRGERRITPALLDLMHATADTVEKILSSPEPNAPAAGLKAAAMKLRLRLDEIMKTEPAGIPVPPPSAALSASPPLLSPEREIPQPETPADIPRDSAVAAPVPVERRVSVESDTVRIPSVRLDELMLQAEEMLSLKLAMRQQLRGVKEVIDSLESVRRGLFATDFLDRGGIFDLDRSLAALASNLLHFKRKGEEDYSLAAGLLEKLIGDTKQLLMYPFSSVAEGFHRMLRELAREQGKEIELRLSGDDVRLDRRILQELKDPLVHLLRNCVDHGVETVAERQAAGKPARAVIAVSAACIDNGKAEITVRDDGRGIDTAQVIAAAVRLGILTAEKAELATPDEAIHLIFSSGLSSRLEATTISGRGLGLAIVSERMEKLGGTITVESATGGGTCFRLVIPLSLATFRGIRIRVGERMFAVPTLNVQNVCRAAAAELKTVGGRETLCQGERTIPIVPLAGILGIHADAAGADDGRTLMQLGSGAERVAFVIDEVIGEDDLLVKGLGPQLARVRNISGATVLGNGTVVPILNATDLLKAGLGGHFLKQQPSAEPAGIREKVAARRILVVDDSVTSRTLLKNVLESYGYDVSTAIDGYEALTALQGGDFDLVSSDVEMPRMDGFELTSRIRADERLTRLPVVLVTSMDSVDDKKRGINAGADAYIVKSSFDQSNLLDIIRKLI